MDGETPANVAWTQRIRFRNPDSLAAVISQTVLVLSAALVIFGLIYVICIVIVITIHHFLFDRDPKKIPDYVKRSVQFSSEDDDSDSGPAKGSTVLKSASRSERKGPTSSKKGLILEKFLSEGERTRNKREN